ncbi:thiopurine S-methyltransferase [Microbulbifer salipaludis]|uniref:Thiopurine S-methyltransferase n=1 Tax=Microbulbifer salipaludis TaxID=187980 RepID=A0ABS3E7Y3_9GAMM|nr:thiopurine S-methyltransferase [Microbulbifer salipaludis]MBN8431422.1 thiopurine S-methyltransferase [Microbulbifer salipaludis]
MEPEFWHDKWRRNEIGFHNSEPHPLLVQHFGALVLEKNSRIFLPLCGKTLDIPWLGQQGFQVAGVELSELAVQQLFANLALEPEVEDLGPVKLYRTEGIDIFVGDVFELTREVLGTVAAIYDRAALVALPEDVRRRYTAHLQNITGCVPQLLITFEYDQRLLPGPPFCVSSDEVAQHYQGQYRLTLLDRVPVPGGLKGKCAADELVWLLGTPSAA